MFVKKTKKISNKVSKIICICRKKSTTRKKYGGLKDIAFSGELSCKGLFSTEKKACVIQVSPPMFVL